MNKIILIGNIGAIYDDKDVVSASLATSEKWKNKTTGLLEEHTDWHKIKLFGKRAELFKQYVKVGDKLGIEGSMRISEYTDKIGERKKAYDVIVHNMEFITKKSEVGTVQANTASTGPSVTAQDYRQASQGSRMANVAMSNDNEMDMDDVPF